MPEQEYTEAMAVIAIAYLLALGVSGGIQDDRTYLIKHAMEDHHR